MRTRMYGGVRGRKTKVGGKPTFVFLLLYLSEEGHFFSAFDLYPFFARVFNFASLVIGLFTFKVCSQPFILSIRKEHPP